MTEFMPQTEIENRLARLQKELQQKNLDGMLILQSRDLFYLTGTAQNACLFLPQSGSALLMVKRSLERAQAESLLHTIVPMKSPKQIPSILAAHGYTGLASIGLELDVLPVNLYNFYTALFPKAVFTDISPVIRRLRSIKSPYEVKLLHQTLQVLDKAFAAVPAFLQAGMSEVELAALFEAELRRHGHSGASRMRAFNQDFFCGNICTGKNGDTPTYFDGPVGGQGLSAAAPQGAGWKTVQRNEPIYIDYTCMFQGYTGDQTRMFCIGSLSAKMEKAYETALSIQQEVLKSIQPGITAEEPYLLALEIAAKAGYADYFMGEAPCQVKFLGHGIGLELDEWPIFAKGIKTTIVPGMTFALEPKFVFPEGAIGIENSFIMTESGPLRLGTAPESITFL